jgi:hypothetical protein
MSLMTVVDSRTGKIAELSEKAAREQIAYGSAIETVPSDPERAEEWIADLRERVIGEALRREWNHHLDAFTAYDDWCKNNGRRALPGTIETLVLYLLTRVSEGEEEHKLRQHCKSVGVIHGLTRHPPQLLGKKAWNSYIRAISFAKFTIKDKTAVAEVKRSAQDKALKMFPDGDVPMRWDDVAA